MSLVSADRRTDRVDSGHIADQCDRTATKNKPRRPVFFFRRDLPPGLATHRSRIAPPLPHKNTTFAHQISQKPQQKHHSTTNKKTRQKARKVESATRSADGEHGGAEEGFEVLASPGVLRDGALDGLLRDRARVAQVDQGGERIVARRAVMRAGSGSGDGDCEVVQLVFEFEHNALGSLLTNPRNPRQCSVVAGADGRDEAVAADAAEDSDGELGADAADGEQLLKEPSFLGFGEAEQRDLVFANVRVNVQRGLSALRRKRRKRSDGDGHVVAHARAFEDGLIGGLREEASAEVSDHAGVIVACGWAGGGVGSRFTRMPTTPAGWRVPGLATIKLSRRWGTQFGG
jgi:hypothetical protein